MYVIFVLIVIVCLLPGPSLSFLLYSLGSSANRSSLNYGMEGDDSPNSTPNNPLAGLGITIPGRLNGRTLPAELNEENIRDTESLADTRQRSGAKGPSANGRSSSDLVQTILYSYNQDSYNQEELWPKELSVIHVQLVTPRAKEIPVWHMRNKDQYLHDPVIDFDSPFLSQRMNGCLVEYKRIDWDTSQGAEGLIQVQITADRWSRRNFYANANSAVIQASKKDSQQQQACRELPLEWLNFKSNLTHLIIRDTEITELIKYQFGRARLDRVARIDIISNANLTRIESRAFDGLTRLAYLSIIKNSGVATMSVEAFAGAKNLEELIWISSGPPFGDPAQPDMFQTLLRSASTHILPNLVHLHLHSEEVNQPIEQLFVNYESPVRYLQSIEAHNKSKSHYTRRPSSGIKLTKDDIEGLSQVKYLQLTNCGIKQIHQDALIPLSRHLLGLNLAGNRGIDVPSLRAALSMAFQPSAGRNHTALDILDLSECFDSRTIPKDVLTMISKTRVSELLLNHLPIRKLSHGDIPPMPNLRSLHLEYSQIEYIDEDTFSGMENLKYLSLRGNYLYDLPFGLLAPITQLEYLDISGYRDNRTTLHVPHKAFLYGTNLKEVNLSYKIMDPLPRNVFMGLFKVEKLHLRGCKFKFIEYLTFFPLKSIIYIDLSENAEMMETIKETYEDSLFGLEAVKMIRLAGNNLTRHDLSIIMSRIQDHVSLLDVSHNEIDSLSAEMLSNFTELQHVDLSHNKIRSWEDFSIFEKNPAIQTLDVSHNQLSIISTSMLEDFKKLKNISFADNPIKCDCHSLSLKSQLYQWLNTTTVHFLRYQQPLISKYHYYCITWDPSLDDVENRIYAERQPLSSYSITCKVGLFLGVKVSLTVVSFLASTFLLFTLAVLIIAFVYHSTLRNLLGFSEDELLYDYEYDAFVSYNVNDSDWVFRELVPNLESMANEGFLHDNPVSNSSGSDPSNPSNGNGNDGNLNGGQNRGIRLCIYDRDFIAGRPISECIAESIRTSRKIILVISDNFVQSPWCRFETDLAQTTLMEQNRDGLIMVKLSEINTEECATVAPQIHYLLKTRIYIEWSATDKRAQEIFWKKLRRALGFSAGRRMRIPWGPIMRRKIVPATAPIATQAVLDENEQTEVVVSSQVDSNKLHLDVPTARVYQINDMNHGDSTECSAQSSSLQSPEKGYQDDRPVKLNIEVATSESDTSPVLYQCCLENGSAALSQVVCYTPTTPDTNSERWNTQSVGANATLDLESEERQSIHIVSRRQCSPHAHHLRGRAQKRVSSTPASNHPQADGVGQLRASHVVHDSTQSIISNDDNCSPLAVGRFMSTSSLGPVCNHPRASFRNVKSNPPGLADNGATSEDRAEISIELASTQATCLERDLESQEAAGQRKRRKKKKNRKRKNKAAQLASPDSTQL